MLADSAASNGEPIRHLAESSAKPMRSRGFKFTDKTQKYYISKTIYRIWDFSGV